MLAKLYLDLQDWDKVRDSALSENLLQIRTLSSAKRVSREIISRLKTLSPNELDLLVHCTAQEQAHLLWIAVCRLYRFIADFAVEVLREHFTSLKNTLHHEDFDAFFNRKSEWHQELEELSSSTRHKLRQVLFRILREAELLGADFTIHPAMLSPRLLDVLSRGDRREIFLFPVFESDLKEWIK